MNYNITKHIYGEYSFNTVSLCYTLFFIFVGFFVRYNTTFISRIISISCIISPLNFNITKLNSSITPSFIPHHYYFPPCCSFLSVSPRFASLHCLVLSHHVLNSLWFPGRPFPSLATSRAVSRYSPPPVYRIVGSLIHFSGAEHTLHPIPRTRYTFQCSPSSSPSAL